MRILVWGSYVISAWVGTVRTVTAAAGVEENGWDAPHIPAKISRIGIPANGGSMVR